MQFRIEKSHSYKSMFSYKNQLCWFICSTASITYWATLIIMLSSIAQCQTSETLPADDNTSNQQPSSSTTSSSQSKNSTIADTQSVMVHEREFISPQVRVQIDCQRDKTIIKVNFTKPFNGILGAGRLDLSKCVQTGDSSKYYEIQVLHNETQCDTQWDNANSSIFNTLFIRFHSSLETGSDIAKNIMCRLTVGDLVVGRRPSVKMVKPKEKL